MHFFYTTNPLNVFATDEKLQRAKVIVESYIEGCEDKSLSDDEIWEANLRGILSFCSRQKDYPDYPALSANDEFKFRSSFVEFFKASCGLDQ